MPTALISGVTGQDGSFLAEQLLGRGYRVVGLHRRLSADNHWRIRHLDELELRSADLLDLSSLLSVMDEVRPDLVFNLAAQSFIPASWEQPLLTGEVTGLGTVRMLEAVRSEAAERRSQRRTRPPLEGLVASSAGALSRRMPSHLPKM